MSSTNSLSGIEITAISSCVPKDKLETTQIAYFSPEEAAKFTKGTGIIARRIAPKEVCASDLAFSAAMDLLEKTDTQASEIDVLVLITQTPDYTIPNTASLLQERLKLKKSTLVFDINLGCSGFVYGLGIVGSILKALNLKKGLLITADTLSKAANPNDRSVWPLFGDAASATLLTHSNSDCRLSFEFYTDGSRAGAIISPNSAHRLSSSMEEPFLKLDPIGIFNFTIKEVPESINRILDCSQLKVDQVNYFVLHQANKVINDTICKKIAAKKEQFLNSIESFGNTSSSSIPLTLCQNLNSIAQNQKIIISGFGVGLSWATALIEKNPINIYPITEI